MKFIKSRNGLMFTKHFASAILNLDQKREENGNYVEKIQFFPE